MNKLTKIALLSILLVPIFLTQVMAAGRPVVDTALMLSHATFKLDSICQASADYIKNKSLQYYNKGDYYQRKHDPLDMDAIEWVYTANSLRIKDFKYINVNQTTYGALLIGCVGIVEFILLDSANPEIEILRTEMNIPDMYARFDRLIDINSDGIMELEIYQSSGSHAMYLSLLSIYPDRLEFIKDGTGLYQFMASGGNIELVDIDSDGIYEIKCSKYKRYASPQEPVIYKWNGSVFKESKQIEDTERQD